MNKGIPVPFQFAKSWLGWFSKGRVCGELSRKNGRGWFATLVGANIVSVCVGVCIVRV